MTLSFHPVQDEDDQTDAAPDLAAIECSCEKPDDQYLLEVDAGSVILVHTACGKQPRGDYLDLVELPPTAVTVTAEPYGGCDGSQWHGEHQCDCGVILAATVNGRAVLYNGRPYLIGRDYKDADFDTWRITGDVDAKGDPIIRTVSRRDGELGGPVPIRRVVHLLNQLTLQPLTPKES